MRRWADEWGIRFEYTQPGKPQQNAYVERFNRTVHYEWLSQYHWRDLDEVRLYATNSMWMYNHERPNMALGGITPKQRLAMTAGIYFPARCVSGGAGSYTMKRFWPLFLMLGGSLIVVGGFFYLLSSGGVLPYQDPTPEQRASVAFHTPIARGFMLCGVAVFLVGCVAGIRRFWPLFPIMGGCLLASAGFSVAEAFSGRPEMLDFVRIARNATIVGWLGIAFFLFGIVSGAIHLFTRKPSVKQGKSQDQSVPLQ